MPLDMIRFDDDHLGVKTTALETLSTLTQRVYGGGRRPAESKMMYEMVCGHSNFVPVMFSGKREQDTVKAGVLDLALALMRANPGDVLREVHQLPLFLGAYKGTLSAADRSILSIVYLNEKHKPGRLGSYAPMLWGQSAISKYSAGNKANFFTTSYIFFILAMQIYNGYDLALQAVQIEQEVLLLKCSDYSTFYLVHAHTDKQSNQHAQLHLCQAIF